ncbi:MAG: dihydroorotate dehydrogenase electron transfer subunit [Endomicrobiaceae bacterium]
MVSKRWDNQLEIKENKKICLNFYEFKVVSKQIASVASAGQFCMIKLDSVYLRRPLSIFHINKKTSEISFLYKVLGKGTDKLASLPKGTKIKVLGPLGKGYDLKPALRKDSEPVLVAGGTGIASVFCLASSLKKTGKLFYGVKTKKELLCVSLFKKLGWKVFISTEDGSRGYKGFITDLLYKKLNKSNVIYTCGPAPMMKKVISVAKELNLCGYASLEEKMACGIGNCQGCAVKIGDEYKMVCKDGPVFPISEVSL